MDLDETRNIIKEFSDKYEWMREIFITKKH